MKTDRELLELAAKATGITLSWGEKYNVGGDTFDCTDMCYIKSAQPDALPDYWNPLADDGDALRLAVKLGLCISFIADCDTVQVFQQNEYAEASNVKTEAMDNDGTRRAIVRAAAAIGEAME